MATLLSMTRPGSLCGASYKKTVFHKAMVAVDVELEWPNQNAILHITLLY
jgi:hypothetical protein